MEYLPPISDELTKCTAAQLVERATRKGVKGPTEKGAQQARDEIVRRAINKQVKKQKEVN